MRKRQVARFETAREPVATFWDLTIHVPPFRLEIAAPGPDAAGVKVCSSCPASASLAFDLWEPSNPDLLGDEVILFGTVYRQLNPLRYARLRKKVRQAEDAFEEGNISEEEFKGILQRFDAVHRKAVDLFGLDALHAAMESLQHATCDSPAAPAQPGQ